MTAPETPRGQHEQSVIRYMIIVTVSQETMGDTARFDIQPRHLLHAGSAAVEKDPRGPGVHQNRRAAAQRIRVGCASSKKANFHDHSLLYSKSDWNSGIWNIYDAKIPVFHHSITPSFQFS